MLHQGNGNESVSGVYERERLRRMARKLGLRLVKTNSQRSEEPAHSTTHQPIARRDTRSNAANAGENGVLEAEFDKCG
jgi:hypothetical protein